MRVFARLLGPLLVCSLLVACGSDTGSDTGSDAGSGDGSDGVSSSELTETTTPEALAAAVLAQLDVEPLSVGPAGLEEEAPDDAVAIQMRLPLSYDDEGMLLQVLTTAETVPDGSCGQDENEDGCTDEDLPDGGRQLVTWQAEEPEEDPGILTVLTERQDPETSVVLYLAGPMIPEDLTDDSDLEQFTLGDLKEVGLDPTIGPMTTPDAIEAGGDLPDEWWDESGTE